MPRNSSGTYSQPANTAAVSGQTISSVAFNTLEADIGSEITNSVDRLGRAPMQANLPMGGYLINNLGAGLLSTDAANVGQIASYAFPDALGGLNFANDATSPLTVLDISAGACSDEGNTLTMRLASPITKTTSAWAVGTGNGMLDTGSVAANFWYHVYLMERPDTSVVDVLMSLSITLGGATAPVVTLSIASPCVITSSIALNLQVGSTFQLSTTGALPTGVTAGTTYYVTSNPTGTTIQFSASQGGANINTSGSQSGVHSFTPTPIFPGSYTKYRRIGSVFMDGSAHIVPFTQRGDEFIWATPFLDVSVTTAGITAVVRPLSVPPNVPVIARIRGYASNAAAFGILVSSVLETSVSPNTPLGNMTVYNSVANSCPMVFTLDIRTGTGNSIRTVSSAGSTTINISTYAYVDTRGRYQS